MNDNPKKQVTINELYGLATPIPYSQNKRYVHRILLIKKYRECFGLGLAECKKAIDSTVEEWDKNGQALSLNFYKLMKVFGLQPENIDASPMIKGIIIAVKNFNELGYKTAEDAATAVIENFRNQTL